MATNREAIAFIQLDSGTVYTVYDDRFRPQAQSIKTAKLKGMTEEEARDSWEAHLRCRGNE